MKKLLFIVLLCTSIYTKAQQVLTDENVTYAEVVSKQLKPLIKEDVKNYKNSILYNKVMPLANLNEFNSSSKAVTHSVLFNRAWQELYDARVIKSNKHIPLKDLQNIANHYKKQGIVQLGLINIDFTQLKKSVIKNIQKQKISILQLSERNRQLARGKTAISYPYENKHVFMISPLNNTVIETFANKNVQFEIGRLALNESAQRIKSLNVVYKGKTTTLIRNSKLIKPKFTQRFISSGVKEMEFNVVFTNGKSLSNKTKFIVAVKTASQRGSNPIKIKATQPFKGYDEPSDCEGNCYGEGEYQVFYANSNRKLKKPIIILDGFDPEDLRKIDNGTSGIKSLIDNQGKEQNMEKFKSAGFDVVILNFPKYSFKKTIAKIWLPFAKKYISIKINIERDGGSDYIERNANVLKALIVKLNKELQKNGSKEKLKIIGPSMGGLISRVALTEMEKANQNHNVDIWISFDSPHLGANIPVGLQYFFNYLELNQAKTLRTPAAKQMLVTQVVDKTYATRRKFVNKLYRLGFPKKTRNLALINGSIKGKRTGTPKGKMLHIDSKGIRTPLGSTLRYQINTFTSHDGGKHIVFERYRRILFKKKRHTAYLRDYTGRGSLDNAPGGYYDMKDEFESSLGVRLPLKNWNAGSVVNSLLKITDKPSKFGIRVLASVALFSLRSSIYLNLYQGKPSFIPSKSSLAFRGSNKLLHENLSNRNLVCTNEIPFDSYYAPNENQEHITLNSKNMNWILEELKGNKQAPFGPAYNVTIKGSNKLCNNQTATYTIANCLGSNINWATSNNLQILSSNNQRITVKNTNSNTTNSWIKATFSNGQTTVKNILGKPSVYYKVEHRDYQPLISLYGSGIPINQQGIYRTQWVKTGGNGQIQNRNSFFTYASGSGRNWYVTGYVKVTNSCGTTTRNFYIRSKSDPCNDIRFEKFAKNRYRIMKPCEHELLKSGNVQLLDVYGNTRNVANQNGVINLENTSPKGAIRILKVSSKDKLKSKMIIMD